MEKIVPGREAYRGHSSITVHANGPMRLHSNDQADSASLAQSFARVVRSRGPEHAGFNRLAIPHMRRQRVRFSNVVTLISRMAVPLTGATAVVAALHMMYSLLILGHTSRP